jgi:hypothetical protein
MSKHVVLYIKYNLVVFGQILISLCIGNLVCNSLCAGNTGAPVQLQADCALRLQLRRKV